MGNRTLRVITDERGSVRWVLDASSGEVVQALRYGPWGEVLFDSRPGFQPFGFAGGLTDQDTGLVRFGVRDYAPWLGRWTTKDPIGQAGGLNVYGYAGNDPINFIDPSGHSAIMCALLRELLGQVPGMQLAMALMDPNSTAWDIAAAIASELPWNRALRAASSLVTLASIASKAKNSKKWVREPSSIQDQMTLDAARSGAGKRIISNLNDPKFRGMEKWEYKVKSSQGRDSVVHYVRNPGTGELMDFKFTKQSTDGLGRYERDPNGGIRDGLGLYLPVSR